jgi:hypothetical protein
MENLSRKVTMNHETIGLYHESIAQKYAVHVKVPNTPWFLAPSVTKDSLFRAAGFKSFDCALPLTFRDEYYHKYEEHPNGVWCYDRQTFGEFIPVSHAVKIVGQYIERNGVD